MSADADRYEDYGETLGDELPAGTTLLQGQYTLTRFLNAGGFGITYLAKDSLDRTVVIKECFPSSLCCRRQRSVRVRSETHQDDFRSIVKFFGQEARALAKLKHPNIVGVHQVFEDNDTAYMALDLVKGQDLLDIIEYEPDRLTPTEVKRILMRLLSAVAYIHDRGILHRDISPDNILIDDANNPVLIDFGAAREEASRRTRLVTQQATVKDGYSPQEFYISGSKQTPASDLYSLAATFYHLIAGESPPVSQTRLATVAEGGRDPYVPLGKLTGDYDAYFLGAIDKCLEIFPKDRILSAQEWMVEIDTERRHYAAKERAGDDEDMQATIHNLVVETNKVVRQSTGPAEPMKKERKLTRERITTREREERWKRFRELNEQKRAEAAEAAGDEAEALRTAQATAADATAGANGGEGSEEPDVLVRKRVRKRTLIGKVLGGVLRRGEQDRTAKAGVAER
jgi:serine/threonine protein kinase